VNAGIETWPRRIVVPAHLDPAAAGRRCALRVRPFDYRPLAVSGFARKLLGLAVIAAVAAAVAGGSAAAAPATAAGNCIAVAAPPSLGATLLAVHRTYERHQPDVHHGKFTGPVGRVHLGRCGASDYALASFDADYNGDYFGTEDQPERFVRTPGHLWRDLGNTGGDPCGSAPTALLVAWKIVAACPD
jgi:hypothetical protein